MKLISMVDYVLKVAEEQFYGTQIYDYANFLKQPLELGMFIPCDEDGNVLEEPEKLIKALEKVNQEYYDLKSNHYKDNERYKWAVETITSDKKYQEYQEAKERVLFKGCSATKQKDYYLVNHNNNIKGLQTIWLSWNGSKTVEDLLKFKDEINLELTESAINKLN